MINLQILRSTGEFENSYLKMFQIANQNLMLVQQEEKFHRHLRREFKRRRSIRQDG